MVKKIAYVRLTDLMDLTRCQLKPGAILVATTCYSLVLQRIVSAQQGTKFIININFEEFGIVKTIIILLAISLILILVGILYGNNDQPVQGEMVALEEAYTAQFPERIPDLKLKLMESKLCEVSKP